VSLPALVRQEKCAGINAPLFRDLGVHLGAPEAACRAAPAATPLALEATDHGVELGAVRKGRLHVRVEAVQDLQVRDAVELGIQLITAGSELTRRRELPERLRRRRRRRRPPVGLAPALEAMLVAVPPVTDALGSPQRRRAA
jgi:hypothetical protein